MLIGYYQPASYNGLIIDHDNKIYFFVTEYDNQPICDAEVQFETGLKYEIFVKDLKRTAEYKEAGQDEIH